MKSEQNIIVDEWSTNYHVQMLMSSGLVAFHNLLMSTFTSLTLFFGYGRDSIRIQPWKQPKIGKR